jgi:hypothetical protein
MEKKYKNCQSCGMPMKKSPNGGGTNADGSISAKYCAYCYENGAFINPDWSAQQMQAFVKDKLKEMGLPGFLAGWYSKGIPKLERWRVQ